jgi:hypothetical protein
MASKRLLNRVKSIRCGNPFNGLDPASSRLLCEHRAGLYRSAIKLDSAGPAARGLATNMRSCKEQIVSERFDQDGIRRSLN